MVLGRLVVVSALLGAVALIWAGGGTLSAKTRHIGRDRMVSFEALPEGNTCLMPGAESASLAAAIVSMEGVCAVPRQASASQAAQPRQAPAAPEHVVGGPGTPYRGATRAGQINRAAARYIKDPYAAWSSIAVNAENDMVVMTDENLFRVVEYSRRDNTPPGAPLTVPRRVIGGNRTHAEMMCGTYIDPKTLDVYITNNDTENWLPMFSREARGNVAPDRLLATPHRTWGIAGDEIRQEIYLTIQNPAAVVVYRKGASEFEAPLRTLEGDATELADPHGIAVDTRNDLIVVANHGHRVFYGGAAVSTLTTPWDEWISRPGDLNQLPRRALPGLGSFELPSINIYARGTSGNTAPLRVIKGARTQLNWPSHVAVHEERREIFVANDAEDSILVFRSTDSGDVAPIRVIKGPRTLLKNPVGVSVDPRNGELWVASMGNYTANVYRVTDNGNAAPLRTIRGGPADRTALMVGNPGGVSYDSKRQEILVPN